MTKYLALHETLDVHELISFKNLCLTKAITMSAFVQDEELKAIMKKMSQLELRILSDYNSI